MSFTPTPHPILRLPTAEETTALGLENWQERMKVREKLIVREKEDPFSFGWEPPIWTICDYLLGLPWLDQEVCARYQRALGFDKAVDVLLINGGNRGGKSEYAAKRTMQFLQYIDNARAWCFHESNQNSVEYQHPLMWKFLPPDQRQKIRTAKAYISWPDELIPADWVETLEIRLATRSPNSKMIVTFTPVRGYSDTVKMFLDGAEITRESPAFLCPIDGGDPLPELALKLENCLAWDAEVVSSPDVPDGRRFEMAPRVAKCLGGEGRRAVVWFHSSDNPYGNPRAVKEIVDGKPRWFVKERFYGIANKSMATRFPKFGKAHIVPADSIPSDGAAMLIVDPSSGRNFYMLWLRVVGEVVYAYREWPSNYDIPEVGVPGPWTLPDGKKPDGRPGPAQDSFGFGLWKLKREMARLEKWSDWEDWTTGGREERESDAAKAWSPWNGGEKVEVRYMDARAASHPRIEGDRPVTLLTEFDALGVTFYCAPGGDIAEGVAKINDLLDYDEESEISYYNKPRLIVSADCLNLCYSLQNWTGRCGNKGASKDPIDALRYGVMAGIEDLECGSWSSEGGGHF